MFFLVQSFSHLRTNGVDILRVGAACIKISGDLKEPSPVNTVDGVGHHISHCQLVSSAFYNKVHSRVKNDFTVSLCVFCLFFSLKLHLILSIAIEINSQ